MSKNNRATAELSVAKATKVGKNFQRAYTSLGLLAGAAMAVPSGAVEAVGASGVAVALTGSYLNAKRTDKKYQSAIDTFVGARYNETGTLAHTHFKQELSIDNDDFVEEITFDWLANEDHGSARPAETTSAPMVGAIGSFMVGAALYGSVEAQAKTGLESFGGLFIALTAVMELTTEWSYNNQQAAYLRQIDNIEGGMSIG